MTWLQKGPPHLTLPLAFLFLISIFGRLLRWGGPFLDILDYLTSPNPSLLVCFALFDRMNVHMFFLFSLAANRFPQKRFLLEKGHFVDIL